MADSPARISRRRRGLPIGLAITAIAYYRTAIYAPPVLGPFCADAAIGGTSVISWNNR